MGNSTHLGNLAKAEKDGVFDATMAYAWASDATAWEHCIEFAGVNEANAHAVLEMIQQLEEAGFSAMPNACKYMIAAACRFGRCKFGHVVQSALVAWLDARVQISPPNLPTDPSKRTAGRTQRERRPSKLRLHPLRP